MSRIAPRRLRAAALLLATLLPAACTRPPAQAPSVAASAAASAERPAERAVRLIPLAGPAAEARAEISGLAWHGEELVLLPQYPERFAGGADGALFAISRRQILDFLDGHATGPLTPRAVPFDAGSIRTQIPGFEGFESIGFVGERVFFTIEASTESGMQAYLVSGRTDPALGAVRLDPEAPRPIAPQATIPNLSDESMVLAPGRVLTLYEANGARVNPRPVAHAFALEGLTPLPPIPFPAIEYRITDATPVDSEGRFWAVNYFFPGETILAAERDPIAERWGRGATHARSQPVERLLEFRITASGIERTETPPIQLELLDSGEGRNWEGIARLPGRGFLIATDRFPTTLLAFVKD